MGRSVMRDTSVLDNIIYGRVDPHIYAFSTNTIPNYLKVGDTYRPVSIRLEEWKAYYKDLTKEYEEVAKVDDDKFFRDYSVHEYLVNHDKKRLKKTELSKGVYYSREFFKDTSANDIKRAIKDIRKSYQANRGDYQFYDAWEGLPVTHRYKRTQTFGLRENQKDVVERFNLAVKQGRKNLLMYAVMRFGKSFTALCCAESMPAKVVVIVSAKDVREEWKYAVESHVRFEKYEFLDAKKLQQDNRAVRKLLKENKRVVVYLTLQDLQGDLIKEKHSDLFKQKVDLLLIDETHFGARGIKYGVSIRNSILKGSTHKYEKDGDVELSDSDRAQIKQFNASVCMHLSGTPYQILMGNEFTKQDIVSFFQYSDVVKEQTDWTDKNNKTDEPEEEWDNPYYGFPQMIRFAFDLNESSTHRLKQMKSNGEPFSLAALFRPQSIKKDKGGRYKRFVHNNEVLDFLKVIDGSKEDDHILSFLNDNHIKGGQLCRHMVVVLPYCASCDALENLIKSNKKNFRNLGDYEIINISSVDNTRSYKSTKSVVDRISECERNSKKTITLTVNRMLTGSTVPYWDTMIFLKDTEFPQEYDQAIFRLQNPFIKLYKNDDGSIIKYNMKPQTLLVDFSLLRMFSLQEQKAQVFNIYNGHTGNHNIEQFIKSDLQISPIITMNAGKMRCVEAADLMQAVSKYSSSRGIAEEAAEIPVDLSLLESQVIYNAIKKENELGSKAGFTTKAHLGDNDTELTISSDQTFDEKKGEDKQKDSQSVKKGLEEDIRKKFQSYYARILFFAFLTRETVHTLEDILKIIRHPGNKRIAVNVGLSKPVLIAMKKMNSFALSALDYKIQHMSALSHDATVEPTERARIALQKFSKLGESEIVTRADTCDYMVGFIPTEVFESVVNKGGKILDVAGKLGEFALSIYQKMIKLGYSHDDIRGAIYTIPTSKLTYEFTRWMYENIGLSIDCIATHFTSYDLLTFKKSKRVIDGEKIRQLLTQNKKFSSIRVEDNSLRGGKKMRFDFVIGNPPYQEEKEGTSDNPVFNFFMDAAFTVAEKVELITPAKFLFNVGKTPKAWNEKMLHDEHFKVLLYEADGKKFFPGTSFTGGIAISYHDTDKEFGAIEVFSSYTVLRSITEKMKSYLKEGVLPDIMFLQNRFDLMTLYEDYPEYREIISSEGKERRIVTSAFNKLDVFDTNDDGVGDSVSVLGLEGSGNTRKYKWIKKKYIEDNGNLHKWKVLVSKSNGASGMIGEEAARITTVPFVVRPSVGYTQSFIGVGAFESEDDAKAVEKYMKTKFVRCLLGILKITQDNPPERWRWIPMQDFSRSSDIDWSITTAEIDKQLYKKYRLSKEEISFIEDHIKEMT